MRNLVSVEFSGVGDRSRNIEQDVPQRSVAAWSNFAASWEVWLRTAVGAAGWKGEVDSVGGVARTCAQRCGIDVRVDVRINAGEVGRVDVVCAAVADGAVSGCFGRVSGGRNVCRNGIDSHFEVAVGEGGVRQSEAKLVDGSLVEPIEGTIIDKNTLFEVVLRCVVAIVRLVEKICAVVATLSSPSEWSLSAYDRLVHVEHT